MLKFNIKEDVEIKLELYKNRHEIIDEIPIDYVDDIKYKFNDIDEISITIPQYISNNGEKRFNRLYRKISTRQIIIVTTTNKNGTEKKQKFTLANKRGSNRKNVGSKSFTAYSWEKTLERQKITVDALSRQLTNKDDNVHIGEGILDLICKKTGWNVGYVDQDARTKTSLAVQSFTNNLFNDLTMNKVTENGLIFDKNVTITVPSTKPLYLTFHYTNAKTFDANGNLLSSMNIMNDMATQPLYTSLKNIKAYHYSEAGNRYGIRYVLTMTDNVQEERICTFTNCANKKLTIETINLAYDFGDVVEQTNVQYANFEAFDDSALKFLKDIQDVFECYFEYDTMTNTINTYAYENLNKNNGYPLTLGENVIEINTTEDESIPTMLKVESENTSIVEHNPNGTDFVENYSYYIKNNLISDSLKNALSEFDRISLILLDQWNVLKNDKALAQQKYTKAESENTSLSKRIQYLTNLLSSYFNSDSARQYEIKLEIEQLEKRVTLILGQMSTYLNEIKAIDLQIENINGKSQKVNMVNEQGVKVFSSDDLAELEDMKEVIQLTDSYYTTPYGLYEYAKKYLEDKANPKVTFDLTTVDLVNLIQNPRGWNNVLELGSLFPVENNEILTEKEIRLVEMELVPIKGTDRVKSNSLKFSNKIQDRESIRKGANIGKTTNKVTGKMATYSQLWEDSKLSNNFISEMMSKGFNLASSNISSLSYKNKLNFSEAGMFIIDATDENNQLYIGSSILAFSNDKFKTCKTALDQNGLIAETIVGHLILGEKLVINNSDGTFFIGTDEGTNNFGLSIYDDLPSGRQKRIFLGISKDSDGIQRAKLKLISKKNQEVVISEEGIIQTSQFLCWDNLSPSYPMRIPYICDEGVMSNKKILMTLVFEKYRAFERGMSSGGTTATSSSGGGGTSSSGGGGTSGNGGYYASTISSSYSEIAPYQVYTGEDTPSYAGSPHHVHLYYMQVLSHAHNMEISIPSHTHTISSHTHTISDHTHTLNTAHSHNLEYFIHEQSSICSNVKIYINDKLVRSSIYGDTQVDITAYIVKNSKNDIRIETESNGRLTVNIFTKSFVAY
ncbi:hypothetical protein [uncultured Clostridium sp.]|uniref:hypothetical protein n=1 Tax=uncultured Clostridium sp. TaxID=59620 RepID=UPI00321706AC